MLATDSNLLALILAAGKGTRMSSGIAKVLHPIGGLPLLGHVLGCCHHAGIADIAVVVGDNAAEIATQYPDIACITQAHPLGTGDAVRSAVDVLAQRPGAVVILYGDTPFVRASTIAALEAQYRQGFDFVLAGFSRVTPGAYGRIIQDEHGMVTAVVEAREAKETGSVATMCNSGIMLADRRKLVECLAHLQPNAYTHEFHLMDTATIARGLGYSVALHVGEEQEFCGINTVAELADAEHSWQVRRRASLMAAGIVMQDPHSVWLAHDTIIEPGAILGPYVVFGAGVVIRAGAYIHAFCHIAHTEIGAHAHIGPHARIRGGSVISEGARIGNFVEVKNTHIGAGTKAGHLAYLGDSDIGAGSNIGAGTVVCNYDGFAKHRTTLGSGVFIGSNATLVSPLSIGDGALVAAATTVRHDVGADDMVHNRVDTDIKPQSGMKSRGAGNPGRTKGASRRDEQQG